MTKLYQNSYLTPIKNNVNNYYNEVKKKSIHQHLIFN